jgi:hypothetical protein
VAAGAATVAGAEAIAVVSRSKLFSQYSKPQKQSPKYPFLSDMNFIALARSFSKMMNTPLSQKE